ncbi:MAG TPA: AraC family ligand binding domain-containing protein [Gemmatimonadaceae bacterium]
MQTLPLHPAIRQSLAQITWITEGCTEVYSQGRRFIVKAGDVTIIPLNVPHEFVFLEEAIGNDIFAPGRQDWVDGTAAYYSQSRPRRFESDRRRQQATLKPLPGRSTVVWRS